MQRRWVAMVFPTGTGPQNTRWSKVNLSRTLSQTITTTTFAQLSCPVLHNSALEIRVKPCQAYFCTGQFLVPVDSNPVISDELAFTP